ncbi:hypothetical protein J6590_040377 [Homalodisca vitripennis]|nr:hypothetical protein J6590_040377 [Homalodisca vitripennis]
MSVILFTVRPLSLSLNLTLKDDPSHRGNQVKQGDNVLLHCHVVGARPAANVTWYNGTQPIAANSPIRENQLRPCHTAVASRPSIHSMNVRVCRDGLESRQTYQTRIRVRGQRHVFLGGWKLSTQLNKEQFDEVLDFIDQGALYACASHRSFADVAYPQSRSSRISQQTAADATNVAPGRSSVGYSDGCGRVGGEGAGNVIGLSRPTLSRQFQ